MYFSLTVILFYYYFNFLKTYYLRACAMTNIFVLVKTLLNCTILICFHQHVNIKYYVTTLRWNERHVMPVLWILCYYSHLIIRYCKIEAIVKIPRCANSFSKSIKIEFVFVYSCLLMLSMIYMYAINSSGLEIVVIIIDSSQKALMNCYVTITLKITI